MAKAKLKPKKFTDASDDRADRKAGIREGSAKDKALDKKRGVPEDEASSKKGFTAPFSTKGTKKAPRKGGY